MEKQNYECSNCKKSEYSTGEIRTTGSGISRFLNLQNNKFATVSCKNCGYTDFYKVDSGSKWGNVLDLFTN
jgi:predicted nucleic-acid-binding Zn-ribbon protein|tara:strand:+ start:515 stop:727 length:213 start_codon:yes stop_codon:yes gene_type:complete